jgi:hypothetical protein
MQPAVAARLFLERWDQLQATTHTHDSTSAQDVA